MKLDYWWVVYWVVQLDLMLAVLMVELLEVPKDANLVLTKVKSLYFQVIAFRAYSNDLFQSNLLPGKNKPPRLKQ